MIDSMTPGSAAAALPASLPRSLARAFNLFLTYFMTLLGFLGGVEEPPAAPPVNEVMMAETSSPTDVKIAVIVNPCSLTMSFSFSQMLILVENFFNRLAYSRKLGSQFFTILTDNLADLFSLRSAMIDLTLSSCICRSGESLFSASLPRSRSICSSSSVSFPALFFSSPLILVSSLSIPKHSRMFRSAFVIISIYSLFRR